MLRAPSRSPLVQLIARILVVALVAAAVPMDATASLPAGEASKLTKSAFGELLAHTGTDPQPYAFTGEPYDPNLGFQYHRARWMDPRVGRFVGMDPFGGLEHEPASLHKYLYAANNPANLVDPSGLISLPDISLALVIRSVVQTLAITVPFRAYFAVRQLQAGAEFGAVAQDFAIGVATDVALSVALLGVLKYAPRLLTLAGQGVQRLPSSVWNLSPFLRGRAIERLILGGPGRSVVTNTAVIDDLTNGVATSIKSIDVTAASYQSGSQLTAQLSQYARDVASYTFNLGPRGQVINQRVLVVAIEEGAATAGQVSAITQFTRNAQYVWPNIKIALVAIP